MSDDVELLRRVYALFNSRDIESVLAAMHPDVVWANGMEGGHVHGRDEVRSYWKGQWAMIDPQVEPTVPRPHFCYSHAQGEHRRICGGLRTDGTPEVSTWAT
jgi:ketosteroid isomerase-like protein